MDQPDQPTELEYSDYVEEFFSLREVVINTLDELSPSIKNPWLVLSGALVVLFVFYAISLVFSYRSMVATETNHLLSRAEIVQQNFDLQLQTTGNALDAIRSVAETELTGSNGLALTGRLELFQKSLLGVRSVAIVNASGITVASNRPETVGFDASGSERYNAIRSDNDPAKIYITNPYITPLGKHSIALAKVLQDSHGNFDGYVLALIDPDYYKVIFSSVLDTPDSMISLAHESGKLIYRVPSIAGMEKVNLRKIPNAAIWEFEASGKSLGFIKAILPTSGTLRYMAWAKLTPTTTKADHYLVATVSRDAAAVDAIWMKNQIPSLILLLALTTLSIIGLVMHQNRQTALAHLRRDASAEKLKSDLALLQTNELLLMSKQLSRHDALTSVPNRLAADERLRGEFVSMKRSGSPYAVMMLDIDFFKKVNDTYGHAVGDDVLRYVSKAMRSSLRENDFVCRYGGEEFLILLPATDLDEARGVAEKVRLAVAAVKVPVAGGITISIGVAIATTADADEKEAIKIADDRLYEAKHSGRNCVVAIA